MEKIKYTVPIVMMLDVPRYYGAGDLAKMYTDTLNKLLEKNNIDNVRLKTATAVHSEAILTPEELKISLQNWEVQFQVKHELELDEAATYRLFSLIRQARLFIEGVIK